MTVPAASRDAQILLVHSHTLDPRPFIGRLLGSSVPDKGIIPWTIDNKYYTADVHFRLLELVGDDDVDDVEASVVVYAFEGNPPSSLPEALTTILTACAPDIAIAVRVQSAESKVSSSRDEFEELFLEAGMDLEDELNEDETLEEYDLPALESIRQTLQTHMWPNMVRKPLAQSPATGESSREAPNSPPSASFPVSFESSGSTTDATSFPALDELEKEVTALEAEARDEFAELDEWLDVDDDGEPLEQAAAAPGFGDDFADFQAAPAPAAASAAPAAMMDPTALLMHLNNVRAQLAGVQDADERRMRAGREVQRVLAQMGLDIDSEGEYTDDDDDDDEDEHEEGEEQEDEEEVDMAKK